MSSRSLAAARARRAGENAPTISGNRPVTSIGSYAAFSQGPPPVQQNIRNPRGQQPQPQPQPQSQYQQSQYQQSQPQTQPAQNNLPFNKLSISDAIGLITLRLGRVEQWIIETDHENSENDLSGGILPDNSRIVDNSLLTNFINRIDTIEKRESNGTIDNEVVTKLSEDITKMNEQLNKIIEESSKHSLITSKHTEQLFRFEREFVETKDILKTFMMKYDAFTNEINEKLGDYEYAISELEKNIPVIQETNNNKNDNEVDEEKNEEKNQEDSKEYLENLNSVKNLIPNLKDIIELELNN